MIMTDYSRNSQHGNAYTPRRSAAGSPVVTCGEDPVLERWLRRGTKTRPTLVTHYTASKAVSETDINIPYTTL